MKYFWKALFHGKGRPWLWAIIEVILTGAYFWINADILNKIRIALDNHDWNVAKHVIVFCAVNVILDFALKITDRSRQLIYTEFNNMLADVEFRRNIKMFIEITPARITEVRGKIMSMSKYFRFYVWLLQSLFQIGFAMYFIISITNMFTWAIIIAGVFVWIGYVMCTKQYDKLEQRKHDLAVERDQLEDEGINGFMEHGIYYSTARAVNARVHELNDKIISTLLSRNLYSGVSMAIIGIGSTVILYMILHACTLENLTSSAIALTLIQYWWRIENPYRCIMDIVPEMSEAKKGFEEFAKIMDYKVDVEDGSMAFDSFNELIFDNVAFWYNKNSATLKDINLTIKKGQKVAFTGESGGGKSSLLNLIERFYDVTSGAITIDGVNIKEFSLESLTSRIAMVSQKTFIMNGTLFDNIAFPLKGQDINPNELYQRVVQAAKDAGLWDWIEKEAADKGGINVKVGNRGLTLSGGLQQRVSLARAIISNPWILILDEATSALDNETEALVVNAIQKMEGVTIISVAHRLSTIKDYDIIYVLKNHSIMEQGTYDELIGKHGEFARLVRAGEKKEASTFVD